VLACSLLVVYLWFTCFVYIYTRVTTVAVEDDGRVLSFFTSFTSFTFLSLLPSLVWRRMRWLMMGESSADQCALYLEAGGVLIDP
jgi:hypothetical protein